MDQDPSKPLLPAKRLSSLGDSAELEALRTTTSMKGSKPRNAPGAVGVQLWLEVPPACEWSDPRVGEALREAIDTLRGLACARDATLVDALTGPVERWARVVTRAQPSEGSADGDLLVENLEARPGAAVVGLDHRRRKSKGGWEYVGASLMVAVGPDRYRIRLRTPGARGEVPFPNEPFVVKTNMLVSGLDAEVEELAADLADFEGRVTDALGATSEVDVRSFLGEAQTLLKRRARLEQRSRKLAQACGTLSSAQWRRDAFTLPDDTAEPLRRIDTRLAQLRTELVDIPQLLLAAGSWRQAGNTEALSLVAAGLVPPTLIAGVLGANIVPWEDPTDGLALIGMLILMLASAVGSILMVRSLVFDVALTGRARAAAVAAAAGLVLGIWLLLEGTRVRTPDRPAASGDARTATSPCAGVRPPIPPSASQIAVGSQ